MILYDFYVIKVWKYGIQINRLEPTVSEMDAVFHLNPFWHDLDFGSILELLTLVFLSCQKIADILVWYPV